MKLSAGNHFFSTVWFFYKCIIFLFNQIVLEMHYYIFIHSILTRNICIVKVIYYIDIEGLVQSFEFKVLVKIERNYHQSELKKTTRFTIIIKLNSLFYNTVLVVIDGLIPCWVEETLVSMFLGPFIKYDK